MNSEQPPIESPAPIGIVVGGLAVAGATVTYWLVLPGVVLGAVAIWLGLRERNQGAVGNGSAAIALGIVAILLVPTVLWIASEAEDWARHCMVNTSDPDC